MMWHQATQVVSRRRRGMGFGCAVALLGGVRSNLIETWDGTSWSVMSSVSPGTKDNSLLGVACPSTTSCQAVGYFQSGPQAQALIESWDGTGWSLIPSPSPGSDATYQQL